MPNKDGSVVKLEAQLRLDAAKTVIKYLAPQLQATQVTGANEGSINMATFDMSKLMSTPDGLKHVAALAAMLAKPDVPALPEPVDVEATPADE